MITEALVSIGLIALALGCLLGFAVEYLATRKSKSRG